MDHQTAFGKTPSGVARVANEQGIPVIAICGSLGNNAESVRETGILAYFAALEEPVREEDLRKRAPGMLMRCAEQVARSMAIGGDLKGIARSLC